MNRGARLTSGPVPSTLIRLTMPMLVAMLAMVGFNIVDTFYVGRLGTEQLAAMGFTLAVVMAVNSLNMGLGVGTTAVISRVIGQGDASGMRRLAMDAILLGVLVALTIVTVGLLSIDGLFGLLGASGRVLEYVRQYMMIWYLGLPLIIIPQIGNSGIRATGDTKTPAKIMITALAVNAVLDPLLIFGLGPFPAYGLRGAAIATVISQGVAMSIALAVLRRRRLVTLARHPLGDLLASWRRILAVGVPAAVTQLIAPLSIGVITSIVAGYGVAAVAGFGVAGRLEMFGVMFVMALGAALVPFVGQNWGAGNKGRVREAVRTAVLLAGGWGAFVWLLALVFGRSVAVVFNDDPEVIRIVVDYLAIVFPSFVFLGALVTVMNALNALHKSMTSLLLSAVRMFVLYVPLAFLGSRFLGVTGVWWGAFVANAVGGVFGVMWFRRVFSRMDAEPQPADAGEIPPIESEPLLV